MLVQTVAPVIEPLSLADAKEFLRVLNPDDDSLITSLIVASREFAENITNRQLKTATFELYCTGFMDGLKLPKNPVSSIVSIEYLDENEVYQTIDSSTYYLYEANGVATILFKTLPSVTVADHKKSVKITFIGGYTNVPESIVQWMKIKVATLYENREELVVGVSVAEMPKSLIDNMLNQYRVKEF